MSKEETPKTKVNNPSRSIYEDCLTDQIVNSDDFQRAVDEFRDGRLKSVSINYQLKNTNKENIQYNPNEITRTIETNNVDPEIEKKVEENLKTKYKDKDVFPVKSYTYKE